MMSSVLYLEQFIESLEPLPGELRKNFYDMREMDEKVEVQKAMAESMGDVCLMKNMGDKTLSNPRNFLGV